MGREKGSGSLQLEKSGRWTLRVTINGQHISRSTGTKDRAQAERFLERFLNPYGLGSRHLPLRDVWKAYEESPDRRDLAPSTLNAKRVIWLEFARWMEANFVAVEELSQLSHEMIAAYLGHLRANIAGTTYNNRVCVLREICHTLAKSAGLTDDPWEGVRLRNSDVHSRRELTDDEVKRVFAAAEQQSDDYALLILLGLHTGMRLGDCCQLRRDSVDQKRGIIQIIPQKTKAHSHGHPVTIPIHAELLAALKPHLNAAESPYVMPTMAADYQKRRWRISTALNRIFKRANIVTSVAIVGRSHKTPEATFHSLRHTFVSRTVNAGIPLTLVQTIVGHESSAMTRHYYHESEETLKAAIATLPNIC